MDGKNTTILKFKKTKQKKTDALSFGWFALGEAFLPTKTPQASNLWLLKVFEARPLVSLRFEALISAGLKYEILLAFGMSHI